MYRFEVRVRFRLSGVSTSCSSDRPLFVPMPLVDADGGGSMMEDLTNKMSIHQEEKLGERFQRGEMW